MSDRELPPRRAAQCRKHYIPHRKSDVIAGESIARKTRTSFTFRKVRGYACACAHPEECDSQTSSVPATRMYQQQQQQKATQEHCTAGHDRQAGQTAACAHGGPDTRTNDDKPSSSPALEGYRADELEQHVSRDAAVETEYVHKVYEAIAPHFSATRHDPHL